MGIKYVQRNPLDQTWMGTLSPHPLTLLLNYTVSHTLMASMSDFDWFMPLAVKVP